MNKLIVVIGCVLILAGCASNNGPSSDQVEAAVLALATQADGAPTAAQLAKFKDSFKSLGCKPDQSHPSATNSYWLCDVTVEGSATHTVQLTRGPDSKWVVSDPGQ